MLSTRIRNKILPESHSVLFLLFLLMMTGCPGHRQVSAPVGVPDREFLDRIAELAAAMEPGERAAVSWIYNAENGNITGLGDQWRDRIEKGLSDNGVRVAARRELGFLIEDAESFGPGLDGSGVWQNSKADVLMSGSYTLSRGAGGREYITLTVKALRTKDGSLLAAINWQDELGPGWQPLSARVKGNVFRRGIEQVTGSKGPYLSALLDRNPPCYPPGSPATITIWSEPGVHIYLLNLAADNSVTLLYPNRLLPDQPLPSERFTFPPPTLADEIKLLLYPLISGKLCRESIKVVASRTPIDFSFLPVPENRIFTGAKGGDMKKMLEELKWAENFTETILSYAVGEGCDGPKPRSLHESQ